MHRFIAAGAFAVALASTALAEADPISSQLIGDWSSPCDAWGVAATCSSEWRVGKHHSHLVQEYAIRRAEDGTLIFSGRGLYRFTGEDVDGMWEDSQGSVHALTGRAADGTLRIIWGSATTEIGRSVYTRHEDGLSVRDSVLTDDGWREFMAVDYAAPEALQE